MENQNDPQLMRLEADVGDMLVPGQQYVLLSTIGPAKCVGENGQPQDFFAVKFRGAFGTRDDAEAHMRTIAKQDKYYDVYLAESGKWLTLPPPTVSNTIYHEDKLNEIFSQYKSDAVKQKQEFEARQEEMIKKSMSKVSDLEAKAAQLAQAAEADAQAEKEGEAPVLATE